MQQMPNYGDERQLAQCVYCGGNTLTRDHVPAKVLLDEPYPANLPVVPACESCNLGFSLDEEYVACLVDCAVTGSTRADDVHRPKTNRILERKPALVSMLTQARIETNGQVSLAINPDKIRRVILKLGRGHAAYELNEPQFEEPISLHFAPLTVMASGARERFESPIYTATWPEVGSRAMQRLANEPFTRSLWITVQEGRYRYMTAVSATVMVRVVISEYLGCEVIWS